MGCHVKRLDIYECGSFGSRFSLLLNVVNLRHLRPSLETEEGLFTAELRSTMAITCPSPAAWRTSVVAPNSDVGTDSI